MKVKKELKVSAIKNGTVIDHIPAKFLFKVITILGLEKVNTPITFGNNLESHKLGAKAIIKLSEKFFEDKDLNKIALIAPQAKLSIIKDYSVIDKKTVKVPKEIIGIAKCMNPNCITNKENVTTKFSIISNNEVTLKCFYCEKITDQEHIEII